MSIELIKEVMDHAPDTLTPAERYALIVLAEDAWLPDREVRHDIADDYLLRRLRMSARSWTNMRGELVRKKVLEKVDGGHNGKRARYKIPVLDGAMKGHPNGDPTASPDSELSHQSGDPTAVKGHRSGARRVTDPVTLTYITPNTPSSSPSKSTAEAAEDADAINPAAAVIAAIDLGGEYPTGKQRAALNREIGKRLTGGWSHDQLVAALNGRWQNAFSRVAVLVSRAEGLPYRPAQPTNTRPRASPSLPPWCGQCGDNNPLARVNATFRTLNGSPAGPRCPKCHPDAQPAAAA